MPTKTKIINFSDLAHFSDRQLEATTAMWEHDYVLYGGAVGGGKSYWLRWAPLLFLIKMYKDYGLKHIIAGLFCEDYPALTDRHLTKIKFEYPPWLGQWEGRINGFRLSEKFGGGALVFRNLDDPSKYQSAEFALVAIDELTKNNKDVFDFLRMRKRWPGVPRTKFIAGTNPGSKGHVWVKELWMDGTFEITERERDQFKFIPAKATDNPHLPEEYWHQLAGLPADWRRAYLEGDWDLFKGQYFTEFRREKHVRRPFQIGASWRKFMGIDHGTAAPFAAYWIAIDWDGNYWVYREYYAKGLNAEQNAKKILSMMEEDETVEYAVVDRSIFSKQGHGETIADILIRNGVGAPGSKIPSLEPSMGGQNTRIAGAQLFLQKLHWDDKTSPKLFFFDTCINAIKTIPSLIHDEHKLEDVDTNGEDHAYDAIRYVLQKLEDTVTVKPPITAVERKLYELKKQGEVKVEDHFNKKFNANV